MTTYDEEIDLRIYILPIIERWWILALFGIIFGVAGFSYSLTQPRLYESSATILLIRSRPILSLAEQFPTISEPIDSRSRMEAILTIAKSDAIASQTLELINAQEKLISAELNSFQQNVKIEDKGDAIQVTASAETPELAERIANTWAEEVVQVINRAYQGTPPLGDIANQLIISQDDFEKKQADLENFLQDNRIAVLSLKIAEVQSLLDIQGQNRTTQIEYYADRLETTERLIIEAEAFRRQMEAGNNSAAGRLGDGLAVFLSRIQGLIDGASHNVHEDDQIDVLEPESDEEHSTFVFRNTVSESGLNLILSLTEIETLQDSSSNYVSDLDIIIEAAKFENRLAEQALASLVADVTQAQDAETLEETVAILRDLETQLEREQSRQLELTSERDLAWQAYQALSQKEAEIRNSAQTENLVSLATRAIQPSTPTSRGTLMNTLIGGFIGGLLGMIWIVGNLWWRSANIHTREPGRTGEKNAPA